MAFKTLTVLKKDLTSETVKYILNDPEWPAKPILKVAEKLKATHKVKVTHDKSQHLRKFVRNFIVKENDTNRINLVNVAQS